MKDRVMLEAIVYAYLVGECSYLPNDAERLIKKMTYEQLEKFLG